MADPRPASEPAHPRALAEIERFDLIQRLQHVLLLVSFTILAVTGLVQKFATAAVSQAIVHRLGGIETTRIVHRSAAVVLGAVAAYHLLDAAYRIFVLRTPLTMLPLVEDFKHLVQDVMFYLGRRDRKASYGRFSYPEKVEYLAVVWGTLIMGLTGFMMWNPLASVRWFNGQAIPAAKVAHGGEAILAVLSIFLWHFYHVHLRHFNKSIFTGRLTRQEMHEEHPAELERIERGAAATRPPAAVLRRRQQVFFPVAVVFAAAAGFGLFQFVTFETSAVAVAPPAETAPIFVPQTPTPSVPPPPSPTPAPIAAATWAGGLGDLLGQRCGACHGATALSGLSLSSYASALQGGTRGPAIVPGDPNASVLVQIQSAGSHAGQLTTEDLAVIIAWIQSGAPEQ
ncbi:MAG: cytochrome b/b6 domain-containing protein [Anaerolineales bacterium]|nr:cytochrome b/b6 domain-containing protein [Anaerolineales bacterium]